MRGGRQPTSLPEAGIPRWQAAKRVAALRMIGEKRGKGVVPGSTVVFFSLSLSLSLRVAGKSVSFSFVKKGREQGRHVPIGGSMVNLVRAVTAKPSRVQGGP